MIIKRDGWRYWVRDLPSEAKALGLSETATREEIDGERHRRHWANELGLPENATWFNIVDAKVRQGRVQLCKRLNLPETSTWTEIENYKSMLRKKLGLPSNAGWWDIERAQK